MGIAKFTTLNESNKYTKSHNDNYLNNMTNIYLQFVNKANFI